MPIFMKTSRGSSPAPRYHGHGSRCAVSAGRARFQELLHGRLGEGKPTHRNVREISFHPETVMGENLMSIKVVGNAFLHSMVRTIVGTLVMVGKGQRDATGWARCWPRAIVALRAKTPQLRGSYSGESSTDVLQ